MESTLSIAYTDLRKEIASFLGWGETAANWSDDKVTRLQRIIDRALRRFYSPPTVPVMGRPVAHVWSFLSPIATLTLVGDEGDYDLPDDFAFLVDEFTYTAEQGVGTRIEIVPDILIRDLRARQTGSGLPCKAATVPNDGTKPGQGPQRWTLMLWPAPAGAYVLNYRYRIMHRTLTEERPYPLGGAIHANTILEFCLAQAELDIKDTKGGIHEATAMEYLVRSIIDDQRLGPQRLGKMVDPSMYPRKSGRRGHDSDHVVTVNGVSY